MIHQSHRQQTDWDRLESLYPTYLKGDAASTDALFRALMRVLQAYFRVRIRSDAEAEDLLQVTLLKIHFARDRYDPARSLKTWVFTVASRSLIDHWRGAASELSTLDSGVSEDSDELGSAIEAIPSQLLDPALKTELHGDLNEALKKLKPIERSIVYLYGVEGLSMAEVAEALGFTESAAKLRAHRAYKELRKFLSVLALVFF